MLIQNLQVRAVTKASVGTKRYPFSPPQAEKKKWVFPSDGMGKGCRLLTAGREWDGKAGSHWVDGTGRDGSPRYLGGTRSWNGSGTGQEIGRVNSREIGREHIVVNRSGTSSGKRSATQSENRSGT